MKQPKGSSLSDYYLFKVLKQTINKIFMKGGNGFPLQATFFPVGEPGQNVSF